MASSRMEQCHNCGKPVTEVNTSADGSTTAWFHAIKDSNKKNPTNQIRELCYEDRPRNEWNVATPPTISEAEAQAHIREMEEWDF